ncbi:MAG: ABC transporter permease, partial [Thermomicrobiales bacterium]
MLRFILKRPLLAIPTLFAVLTIIFLLMRVIPGDPSYAVLGDYATEDAVKALRTQMGLDKSIWEQYVTYMGGIVRGDLGDSLVTRQPAWQQIRTVLPYSLELTGAAIVIALAIGIPAGVITAVRRNTWVDYLIRVLSLAGLSAPAFY